MSKEFKSTVTKDHALKTTYIQIVRINEDRLTTESNSN